MESLINLIKDLLLASDELRGAEIVTVTELAGDMSARRFYRAKLSNSPVQSIILVALSGTPGPHGLGVRGLTQDDTYVEVGGMLARHNIRVPKLFVDGRSRSTLLIEDVGDTSLLTLAQSEKLKSEPSDRVSEKDIKDGFDPLRSLYLKALLIQKQLRDIPLEPGNIAFERRTSEAQRKQQIREFLDHYAIPRGFSNQSTQALERLMESVCSRVEAHPQQVSHFDFMASNIHVLPENELCLIDFQDMCLDSPARDIVSLLNDRDSDIALGRQRQRELLRFFMDEINIHPSFPLMYDEYLILWDLRVSGRFALLSEQRGMPRYAVWLPGTLRRLGRTLFRARDSIPEAGPALEALINFSPEVRQGFNEPWEFPA